MSKWVKRSKLRPGEIFLSFSIMQRPHIIGPLVVIDDKTEVCFFSGLLTVFGDVAPSVEVEVIS